MEELLKPPITVKVGPKRHTRLGELTVADNAKCHPPSLLAKPCALLPIMLLPREQIPLSFLDLSGPHEGLPAARNYESLIRILELEGRLGSNVLLALAHSNNNIYAIEREHSGLYTICKLGPWVDVYALAQSAAVVCRARMRRFETGASGAPASEPPLTTPHMHKENKRKRLAIEELQSLVRKKPRSQSVAGVSDLERENGSSQLPTPVETTSQPQWLEAAACPEQSSGPRLQSRPPIPPPAATSASLPPQGDTVPEPPTGDEILQNLRNQYLEALYHSKVCRNLACPDDSLTTTGFPGVLCEGASLPSPGGFSSRFRLQFRDGRPH